MMATVPKMVVEGPVLRSGASAGAACLMIAAVGQLAQYLVTPVASVGAAPGAVVAQASAHPAAMQVASWLDLAIFFLVPAVLVVGRLAGAPRSMLASAATGIAFVTTLLGSGYLLVIDVLVRLPGAEATLTAYTADPLVSTVTVLFIVGHMVGFVLLAVALWRARTVPVWAAVALALSPLAEVAGEAVDVRAVTVAAYGLLVVAFAAFARNLLRADPIVP